MEVVHKAKKLDEGRYEYRGHLIVKEVRHENARNARYRGRCVAHHAWVVRAGDRCFAADLLKDAKAWVDAVLA